MSRESQTGGKVISVDSRPVRDIGNAIGCSLDKQALRELGLVDDNGELVDDVRTRQTITDDGKVQFDLPVKND